MLSSEELARATDRLGDFTDPNPLKGALALGALGLPVFPVHSVDQAGQCSCGRENCRDAGKHPRTPNGLRDATRDASRIKSWWRKWPDASVGVTTGEAAGIWVLDVDPDKGGLDSLEKLAAVHGKLRQTWCVETGGKGLHIWFRWDNTALRNSAGRIAAGLDVRAEGGYAIVPPSRHASGLWYRWAAEWHPTRISVAPAPLWLVDLARQASTPKMIPPDPAPYRESNGGNHLDPVPAVIKEGQRNATLASLAGAMRHKGFTGAAIYAALLVENAARCYPPLPESEIIAIARSIGRYAPAPQIRPSRRPSQTKTFVEFIDGKAVAR